MKNTLRIFIGSVFFFSFSIMSGAQESHTGISTSPPKFKKHLAVGSAFSYAVINNRLEMRGQFKPGVNFNLNYCTKPWFRWSMEYSYYFPHNSSPGLANIHAWNTELNGNFQMNVGQSDLLFRLVFGASYLDWKGTYVGPDLTDNHTWYIGKLIEQNWVAGNLGVGFSHTIGKQFNGYADFRMRFASEEKDLVSISDTEFLFGVQWEPKMKSYNGENNTGQNKKAKSKSGAGRVYKWLKKRN